MHFIASSGIKVLSDHYKDISTGDYIAAALCFVSLLHKHSVTVMQKSVGNLIARSRNLLLHSFHYKIMLFIASCCIKAQSLSSHSLHSILCLHTRLSCRLNNICKPHFERKIVCDIK